jgi:hypothetical protein
MALSKEEQKLLEGRKRLIAYGNCAALFFQSIFLPSVLCLSSLPRQKIQVCTLGAASVAYITFNGDMHIEWLSY